MKKIIIILGILLAFSFVAMAQEPPFPIDSTFFIVIEKKSSYPDYDSDFGDYQPRLFLSIEDMRNYSRGFAKDSIFPYLIIGKIGYKLEWAGEVSEKTIVVLESYQDWKIKVLD